MEYTYLGDKMTDPKLKGIKCNAVRREDGKCIRSGSKMVISLENGTKHIILARQLRKIK